MCFIDEDNDKDDSQTEEFITMMKTLDHVLKLICEAKLNKREIKNFIEKEINEATEELINYLTKESAKRQYLKEFRSEYRNDVRESFIDVAINCFINEKQEQKLFKANNIINISGDTEEAENILNDYAEYLQYK